jgi:hypothetical protein
MDSQNSLKLVIWLVQNFYQHIKEHLTIILQNSEKQEIDYNVLNIEKWLKVIIKLIDKLLN